MRSLFTAIIHLRDPVLPGILVLLRPTLGLIPGVHDVRFQPEELLIMVEFDGDQTGLADIVRTIEDCGPAVSGVAQRRLGMAVLR